MSFKAIEQDYFHRVSHGPAEGDTFQLRTSDMAAHMPVLEYYSSLCKVVVELGFREGVSGTAILCGLAKSGGILHSYDIDFSAMARHFGTLDDLPAQWRFYNASSLEVEIPDCDGILFDTLHYYSFLKNELALHGRKARKFLMFHDTFACGEKDLTGADPNAEGITAAIEEFIEQYPGEYETRYKTDRCNGLWILERKY